MQTSSKHRHTQHKGLNYQKKELRVSSMYSFIIIKIIHFGLPGCLWSQIWEADDQALNWVGMQYKNPIEQKFPVNWPKLLNNGSHPQFCIFQSLCSRPSCMWHEMNIIIIIWAQLICKKYIFLYKLIFSLAYLIHKQRARLL